MDPGRSVRAWGVLTPKNGHRRPVAQGRAGGDLATLPVAFALAWLLARARFPGKMLIEAIVHLPLVVPPVVTGWLLLLAFAPAGPLGAA